MEENRETKNEEKKKFRVNIHVVFGVVVVLMLAVIVSKFIGFGRVISQDEIDAIPAPENTDTEVLDDLLPVIAEDDGTFPEDDGVTTIVCLGNSPFSDDRNSEDNLCNLLGESNV